MLRDKIGRTLPGPLRRFLYDVYRNCRKFKNRLAMRDGVVTLNNVRLRADPNLIGQEVVDRILLGDYEGREARMVQMFLKPEDCVLELGAGIGYIGLLCAQRLGRGRVFSFEANPMMEGVIRENYSLNDWPDPDLSIGILCDKQGEATFYVPDVFWAASTTPIPGARQVKTPMVSLNDTIRLLKPTFLIMDIEGGEIDVIDIIEPQSVKKIAMELHPQVTGQGAIDKMITRLSGFGFRMAWMSNAGEHAYFERD